MIKISYLGIDPGFAIVGVGVLDYEGNKFSTVEYGAITTEAGDDMFDRLKKIYDDLVEIIERVKPDAVAIEELFFNSNQKTAINVAQARGVLVLAAKNHDIPVFEYTPLQVKQAVVGYGRADKKQVQQMTKAILNLEAVQPLCDFHKGQVSEFGHGGGLQANSPTMNNNNFQEHFYSIFSVP